MYTSQVPVIISLGVFFAGNESLSKRLPKAALHVVVCSPRTMPRLIENERNQALEMLRTNTSVSAMARVFNVQRKTIQALREHHQATGSTRDRPRSSWPKVTMPDQDLYIRSFQLCDCFKAASKTAHKSPRPIQIS